MKDIPALESILSLVTQQDSQARLKGADELLQYLKNPSNDVEFYGLDKLIDGLCAWVSCSNFKVSLAGLEVLGAIVLHIGTGFRQYLAAVIPVVVDRLGDSKQQVREDAQDLLIKFMDPVSTPQHVFEILVVAFGHKNWRVREEVMHLLCKVLNLFGAQSLTLNKFVPHICKLLGDPNSQVRDTAINTLVEIYRHVGEKVRTDLSKKGIPSSRLSIIYAKFDDCARAGNMIASVEPNGTSGKVNGDLDSTDGAKLSTPSRASSAKKPSSAKKSGSHKSQSSNSSGLAAGAVDEAEFINSYNDCPEVKIYSAKDLSEEMTRIQTILSDDKNDWEQRVMALKKVRGIIMAGGLEYDNFMQLLKQQEGAYKLSVKDLRSAIVKEACVTLSNLSSQLGHHFEHTAEAVIPVLINLIPNTAKVMATSGCTAIRIILKHTHSHRIIPHFFNSMSSKSNIIRRQCAEYIALILEHWSTNYIKPHVNTIEEIIHKGLGDADPEARAQMRRAFWHFSSHFKDKADSLMKQLDSTKQRMLESDKNLLSGNTSSSTLSRPSSTSSKSLTLKAARTGSGLKRQAKMSSSQNSLDDLDSGSSTSSNSSTGSLKLTAGRKTVGASSSMSKTSEARHGSSSKAPPPSRQTDSSSTARSPSSTFQDPYNLGAYGRSLSNLDPRSLSRAQAKSRKSSYQNYDVSPTDTENRRRSRIPNRAVASQPSSRSTSPLRLGLTYPPRERTENFVRGYSPHKSKIPTPLSRNGSRSSSRASSRQSSRDPSPDSMGHRDRRLSSDSGRGFSRTRLTQAQAASMRADGNGVTEDALRDAWEKSGTKKRTFSFNSQCSDDDDQSDVSSVCSDRSHSDRSASSGHRTRVSEDVTEIVRLCTSSVWSDRRDGILALQSHLRSPRTLGHSELPKIKDCLARFFFDSHNKVYSMFLDALCEFIVTYKVDLQDWLFVLLSRLLSKLGTDLLSSLQSKIVRVLDVIRDSFPYDVQFSVLTRFITDQTQTPNIKVKIAILQYLQGLINLMDSSDFTNSSDTRLAVSRIITWNAEPKSTEVRKESANVIVALFELNTPEFSMMLSVLPKSFQDGATKLLHNHLKTSSQGFDGRRTSPNRPSPVKSPSTNIGDEYSTSYSSPRIKLGYRTLSQPKMSPKSENGLYDFETYKAESPQSPEEQRLPMSPATSPRTPFKGHFDDPLSPVSSGSLTSPRSHGPDSVFPEDAPSVSSGYHSDEVNSQQSEPGAAAQAAQSYNPSHYQDQVPKFPRENGFDDEDERDELDRSLEGMEKPEAESGRGNMVFKDSVSPLVTVLVDTSADTSEEKKDCLLTVMKLVRADAPELWGEKFPALLSGLLNTLKDNEGGVRSLTLRVLKDMIRMQPYCFFDYSIKLIRSVLEANKDPEKEVVRAAEDTAASIAKSIPPEDCISILSPIILNELFPINLAAIKMLNKVVEDIEKTVLVENLPLMTPGLVKCYDHQESSVRKASVFCLVALHTIVGEDTLRPHLSELSGTKMKLLNLYIKRHQAAGGNGGHMT